MKFTEGITRGSWIRLVSSITLASLALGLFLISRTSMMKPIGSATPAPNAVIVGRIDREVDSVLSHFRIESAWIRKKVITLRTAGLSRIERLVAIPPDVLAVQLNVAMNTMAKKYDARAIASENLMENTITIHIELLGYIIQTIVLKTNPELHRGRSGKGQVKA